ncbi:hypothetical protein KKF84_15995 [Myxococcota bacterium]|nr:hypothetical protein [Myxococcota bacterium]MBU1536828.1 hypothetical protein [Myxococcota bacterium]
MNPIIKSLSNSSRQMVKSMEQKCQVTILESDSTLTKLQGTMALGTLYLLDKMSHLMDRSMELVESQLEESRMNQELLQLKKELLKRELEETQK